MNDCVLLHVQVSRHTLATSRLVLREEAVHSRSDVAVGPNEMRCNQTDEG